MSRNHQLGSSIVTTQGQAVVVRQTPQQVVAEMKAQVALIQGAITAVMKEGEHFGSIPGCGEKKTLLKSGAEKLMVLFRLGVEPIVEAYDDGDSITYRVKSRLFHIETGNTVGFGLGECSTLEDKYNWKGAICDEEFEATSDDRKRVKWSKGKDKAYSAKQVRTNYKDISNTVLKMAKKRSLVDGILTCTAASDCFTQDLEEFDPDYAKELAGDGKDSKAHQNNTPPKTSSAAANASSDEETSALKAHGLWVSTKDGVDIVEGNTYQKGDHIKPYGFKWDGDTKKWKRPAKVKASQPAAEKPTSKPETTQTMTLEDIDNAIAEIGGILSEPTPKNGKVFVQAVDMEVDEVVTARLKELGFKEVTGKWVKDVTSLYSADEIKTMQEAKNLFD